MITSDDDTAPFFPNGQGNSRLSSNTNRNESNYNHSNKKDEKSSFSPYTNLTFIYFIVSTLLSIGCGIFYFMDDNIGYICSGIIGLVISTFGVKHFRTLLNLKLEIDNFAKLNVKFQNEHKGIKLSVNRLSAANDNLRETHNRLSIANEKNRANLTQFRNIQDNMEQFSVQSVQQLSDVVSRARTIESKWHDELYKHERHMLHTVFDRFCSYQNHVGMTKKEFNEFSLHLPRQYQQRFERMGTFEKLAGNKEVILLEDFAQTLDIFAEMQANDCDIDFEIRQTKKKRKMNPSKSLIKRRTEYFNKQQRSAILKFVEEHRSSNNSIDSMPRHSQLKLTHLAVSSITEDERDYDDDLIKYQSQIVITRRTTPGHRFLEYQSSNGSGNGNGNNGSGSNLPETQLSVIVSGQSVTSGMPPRIEAKDISTVDLFESKTQTPTPTTPGFGGRDNWQRRGIVFDANPLIKDISGYHDRPITTRERRVGSDVPNVPPNIEEMTTQSIDNHNFTDSHMNIFMTNLSRNQRRY